MTFRVSHDTSDPGDVQPAAPEAAEPAPNPGVVDVREAPAAPARRATPGSAPRPRRQPSLTTPDLAAKLEDVRFGDYHSILEVTPGASPFLVREHFDALSRLYNPTGWPHRLTADEVHILAEIGEGIREAFAILGHSELRARYEQALARQPG